MCLFVIYITSLEKSLLFILLSWIVCFFDTELKELFIYFGILTLYQLYHLQILSSIQQIVFYLFIVSFAVQELLTLIRSQLPFCFDFFCLRRKIQKNIGTIYVRLFYLFSGIFRISGLTFRSVIHFEFVFVNGMGKYSSFTLLHMAVQFFQHHLLKRRFSPLSVLPSFVID